MQLAAQEAKIGHTRFAQELRSLIDDAKRKASIIPLVPRTKPISMVPVRGELSGLFEITYPKSRLVDMALDEGTKHRIEQVLLEQRQQARLKEHGLLPQ